MSKVEVCDLCKKPIMQTYSDEAYMYIVKKRWHSYDGFTPFREKTKIDICDTCMRKVIKAPEMNTKQRSIEP